MSLTQAVAPVSPVARVAGVPSETTGPVAPILPVAACSPLVHLAGSGTGAVTASLVTGHLTTAAAVAAELDRLVARIVDSKEGGLASVGWVCICRSLPPWV